jgi:hypothetical protein
MIKGNNKGSTLVMVLIAVLILSMISISALTQSGTEMATARNFLMDKNAFYAADAGIQVGINNISHSKMNPAGVNFSGNLGKLSYYTGLMSDTGSQNVTAFQGFKPPPPVGQAIDLGGGELGMGTVAWNLNVSSVSAAGTRNQVRKQIAAVIVTMVSEY